MIPADGDWWRERGHRIVPTVLLTCGVGGCGITVGEVLVDGDKVLALIHEKFGDRTVPFTPRRTAAELGLPVGVITDDWLANYEELKFEALDKETLRYLDANQRVAKRHDAGALLTPLEGFGFIVCPVHGLLELPDSERTVAELREFLAGTRHASKRRFLVFHGTTT